MGRRRSAGSPREQARLCSLGGGEGPGRTLGTSAIPRDPGVGKGQGELHRQEGGGEWAERAAAMRREPLLSQPLWAPFRQPSIHSRIADLRSAYYIHAVLLVLELRPQEKETPTSLPLWS